MNKQLYKKRCGQIRLVLRGVSLGPSDPGIFRCTTLNGTTYIYNTLSRNIIFKERVKENHVGIQYRATSIYAPLLSRLQTNKGYTGVRRIASPNMRRHVRDVRARVTT